MIKKLVFLCLLARLYPAHSFDVDRQLHAVTENIFKIQSLCIDLQNIKVTDVRNLDIKMLKTMLLETKELLNDLKNIVIVSDLKVHVGAPFVIILYTTIDQMLLLDFESHHPYIVDNTFFSINSMPDILYNLAALFSLFPIEEESSWYTLPKKVADTSQDPNLDEDCFAELKKYSREYIENMRCIFSNYTFLYLPDTINKFADSEKVSLEEDLAKKLIYHSSLLYSSTVTNVTEKYEIIHILTPVIHILHNILNVAFSNGINLERITQNKIEYLFITLIVALKYYSFDESKNWRTSSYYNF
jgi:hypothetical protein